MDLYFAGNFPQLRSTGKEAEAKEFIESHGYEYKRLVSFFFPEDCATVMELDDGGLQG